MGCVIIGDMRGGSGMVGQSAGVLKRQSDGILTIGASEFVICGVSANVGGGFSLVSAAIWECQGFQTGKCCGLGMLMVSN